MSPETIEKMRLAHTGKQASLETRAKMSKSAMGRIVSEVTRAKLRGRKHTDETKAKIGNANRGRPISIETRIKCSAAGKRRVVTDNTRRLLSESGKRHGVSPQCIQASIAYHTGCKHTAEQIAKHAAIMRGRHPSEATRLRIRLALKGKHKSAEARLHMSQSAKKGSASHLWKGGVQEAHWGLHNAIRDLPQYKKWRGDVFARDNFTCQHCGQYGHVHAHHIEQLQGLVNKYQITTAQQTIMCDPFWDVNNGIVLCDPCHRAEHRMKKVVNA